MNGALPHSAPKIHQTEYCFCITNIILTPHSPSPPRKAMGEGKGPVRTASEAVRTASEAVWTAEAVRTASEAVRTASGTVRTASGRPLAFGVKRNI